MPAPYNERQALERERGELPGQLATYQGDLDATAPGAQGAAGAVGVADSAGAEAVGGG